MIDRKRVVQLKAAAPPSTRPECPPQAPKRDETEADLIDRIMAIPFNEWFDLEQFREEVGRLTSLAKLRRNVNHPGLASFLEHANLVLGPKPRRETEADGRRQQQQMRRAAAKMDRALAAGATFAPPNELAQAILDTSGE